MSDSGKCVIAIGGRVQSHLYLIENSMSLVSHVVLSFTIMLNVC